MPEIDVPNYLPFVITLEEAAELWDMRIDDLIGQARKGCFHARQAGSIWLVSLPAMIYVYGWPSVPMPFDQLVTDLYAH